MKDYPANPKTIGEMIRKRRPDLGLRQADVAEIVGCDSMTAVNWEKATPLSADQPHGGSHPIPWYQSLQIGGTVAERLVNFRTAQGKTQMTFAAELGIDPSTLAKWERGERMPSGKYLKGVHQLCPDIL